MSEREGLPNAPVDHTPKQDEQDSAISIAYSRRARRQVESVDDSAAPQGYRAREFGPESRGDGAPNPVYPGAVNPDAVHAGSATSHGARVRPSQAPTREVPRWGPSNDDPSGDLTYFTQAVPNATIPAQPTKPPVVDSVPAAIAPPPRTLTRRELRELEEARGTRLKANDAPAAVVAPVAVPAPVTPALVAPLFAAPQPPTASDARPTLTPPTVTQTSVEPPVRPVAVQPMPAQPAPAQLTPVQQEPERPAPVVSAPSAAAPTTPVAVSPVPLVAPPIPLPVNPAPVGLVPDSAAATRGIDRAPEVFTAPVEHWSTQNRIDDANGDAFIRSVGMNSGALTASALVIPSIPTASDITRPLSSTGEILVTGSIDLPRSLGSTGAHPARYDHSDIDALFAAEDHDFASSDSAPVRAIRAVSTHTSTHGVISAKKPVSNRLPMMMAVTAGILAVGVAALFAAALVFGYF